MCPGGEIGRRTGLKILGPVRVVPVQVWPGAPRAKQISDIGYLISDIRKKIFCGLEESTRAWGAFLHR